MDEKDQPALWTTEEVSAWVANIGPAFSQFKSVFNDNDVDGDSYVNLTNQDLDDIGIKSNFHKKKILKARKGSQRRSAHSVQAPHGIAENWTAAQVGDEVAKIGPAFEQYKSLFNDNDVDGESYIHLTDQDLDDIGVSSGFHKKKILKAAKKAEDVQRSGSDSKPPQALLDKIAKLELDDESRKGILDIALNTAGKEIEFQEIINDEGAAVIGEALCINSTLEILSLSLNFICDAGVAAIARGLMENTTLQKLYLVNNQISDDGAVSIREMLSKNYTLILLNLNRNYITDSGAAEIAQGLTNNIVLQHLRLNENEIGRPGTLALAKAFRLNLNLQTLSVNPKGFEYQVVIQGRNIGHGEFGSVFMSSYKDKEVVAKESHGASRREETYERLILQGLPEHKNVVSLSGIAMDHSLLLEAHKGGSVRNYAINHEAGVPLPQFLMLSHGMCVAIEHLHKYGIVHRDIALRNYVLTEDMLTAVLLDFGLAWLIEEQKSVAIRPDERMPFRQCAPEVLSTLRYSKGADIWQLGLSMWQLLQRGRPPFLEFANGQQLVQYLNMKMVRDNTNIPLTFKKNGATRILRGIVKEVVVFCCPFDPAERPTATRLVEKIESLSASLEEEKGVTKYKPDHSDVESGLNAYNYTDYTLKTDGRSDYIGLDDATIKALNVYNSGYNIMKKGGQSDYANLKEYLEEHQDPEDGYDTMEKGEQSDYMNLKKDLEEHQDPEDGEDLDEQYQVLETLT